MDLPKDCGINRESRNNLQIFITLLFEVDGNAEIRSSLEQR